MDNTKQYIYSLLLIVLTAVCVVGCEQEEITTLPKGTLCLKIGHTSKKAETRATPLQLGKPLANKFSLKIQRSGSESVAYDGKFVEDIELRIGTYDIMAYYGENVKIGKDSPYYEGAATATIEENQSSSVTIPCRVANALVSVIFGRDEEEQARFAKHYTSYGLAVRVGEYSLNITNEDMGSSIYFPAGSSPTFLFYGTLRNENNRLVSCQLTSEAFPETFEAADHSIITLSLPDPESALNVNITKVDMKTVMLDETIPLSWLPIPTAIAQHHYNDNSELMGTDITFSNSYPGMQWKAVVTNNQDQEVRSSLGAGELVSSYNSSSEWPYLPSGNYKATFYIEDDGRFNKVGSRDFSVDKPELAIVVDGYSAHTKYLEGDIDGANACNRNTIYNPSVKLNVSEALLVKHGYSFTYTYAGATEQVPAGKNEYSVEAITNQTVSFNPYRLRANASFDGVSIEAHKDFYITGIPVTYAPPTKDAGWTATGTVTFSDNNVELGYNAGQNSQSITNKDIAIPQLTKVSLDYDIMIKTGWAKGTTLTITVGNNQFLSQSKGTSNFEKTPYKDTVAMILTNDADEIKCHNSYGLEQTYSCIYSLSLKYSK